MQLLKMLIGLWLALALYSCKVKTVTVRYEGRVVERYQALRKTNIRHGFYEIYHDNGNLALEHNYVDGELDGVERIYHENGALSAILPLKDGDYQGHFTYYYLDGTIKQRGYYKNDVLTGELCNYYSNGQTQKCVMMEGNTEQGDFREYSENGVLTRKGSYVSMFGDKEGLEDGLVYEYHPETMKLLNKKRCKDGFCCTIWERGKGFLRPSTSLCDEIMNPELEENNSSSSGSN
jgi:antitoxin component YwqK of YwqJK toxin-antitoxin module